MQARSTNTMKLTRAIRQLWKHLAALWPGDLKDFLATVDAIALADALYRHHFPTNGQPVRLVVLSESPAFTPTKLMQYRMDPKVAQKYGIDASILAHLNLVHCLSYGESWTLEDAAIEEDILSNHSLRTGTPPFWRVLSTLAGDADATTTTDGTTNDPLATTDKHAFRTTFSHVVGGGQKNQTVREQRLQAKINILRRMQDRGIVLFDICPLPIYTGGGKILQVSKKTGKTYWTPKYKLKEGDYRNIVRTSFIEYTLPLLQELSPERVVILGKKLEHAIGGAQKIEQTLPRDCQYLGVMHHPSYNRVAGVKYAPHLQQLRDYAAPSAHIVTSATSNSVNSTPSVAAFISEAPQNEIWSGIPIEHLEGGWPPGWLKKTFRRSSGKSAGNTDSYWYSPIEKKKLRSMIEVRCFLKALDTVSSDENVAFKSMKNMSL